MRNVQYERRCFGSAELKRPAKIRLFFVDRGVGEGVGGPLRRFLLLLLEVLFDVPTDLLVGTCWASISLRGEPVLVLEFADTVDREVICSSRRSFSFWAITGRG